MYLTEPVLHTTIAAIFPCLLVDLVIRFILIRIRREAGIPEPSALGIAGWFFSTLLGNFLTISAFAFSYLQIWGGRDKAFIFGGAVWLIVVVPVLLMARYMEHERKKILIAKVFGWLAKAAFASAGCTVFIG